MSDADPVDQAFAKLLADGLPKRSKVRRAPRRRGRYYPEESPQFEIGDVVQLRSGGPLMTIWTMEPAVMPGFWPWMYRCDWFYRGKRFEDRFPDHVLRKVNR